MFYVEPENIRRAWKDGAHNLVKALEKSDGDMTEEGLINDLETGKKVLIGHEGAWAVVQTNVYHTKKVMHVDAIYAPNMTNEAVFAQLEAIAKHNGCAQIQGACQPSIARLWARKFGFREAYTIMRKDIQ